MTNCAVGFNTFSSNPLGTYALTATEITTGLSSTQAITISQAPVTGYTGSYASGGVPSLTAPMPSPSPAPANAYCTTTAMSNSPFAGGSGTQTILHDLHPNAVSCDRIK